MQYNHKLFSDIELYQGFIMASYDSSLFERTREGGGFTLPQRFKHVLSLIVGTSNVLAQLGAGNYLIRAVPRPLAYVFLFIFFFLTFSLFYLTVKQLAAKKENQQQQFNDVDLFEMFNNRQKYFKTIGSGQILLFAFIIFNLVLFFAIWNEEWSKELLHIHLLCMFYSIPLYFLYKRFMMQEYERRQAADPMQN